MNQFGNRTGLVGGFKKKKKEGKNSRSISGPDLGQRDSLGGT